MSLGHYIGKQLGFDMPFLWLIDTKSSTTGNEGLPPDGEVNVKVFCRIFSASGDRFTGCQSAKLS